ncbi:MAG: type IX secretion system sortase PorU [Bacteroidia bacterium]
MKSKLNLTFGLLAILLHWSSANAINSALNSGNWYKLSTRAEGIYAISFNDLQNLGINPAAIDPRNISIYSNGPGPLKLLNAAPRPVDLNEIAIRVAGESDGVFDPGDSIFFYAASQTIWQYDTIQSRYTHENNPYSDSSYFFLTVSANPGKRIQDRVSLPVADDSTSTYEEHMLIEKDSVNITHRGVLWHGEIFDMFQSNTRTFSYDIANLDQSVPVKLSPVFAARQLLNQVGTLDVTTNGNSFSISYSGTTGTAFDVFAQRAFYEATIFPPIVDNQIQVTLNSTLSTTLAWLDYIEINCRKNLTLDRSFYSFRESRLDNTNSSLKYKFDYTPGMVEIFDVTDFNNVRNQLFNVNTSQAEFTVLCDMHREFISYNHSSVLAPVFIGQLPNQNLHQTTACNMLIVSTTDLMSAAQNLASYHQNADQLSTTVVDVNKIYNEYSSGALDPVGIRDFVRDVYQKSILAHDTLKYLLLMGRSSYDYRSLVSHTDNFLPDFQIGNTINPLMASTTDDYFAFMDSLDDAYIGSDVDLSVGRIPARTLQEANNYVSKLMNYRSTTAYNSTRTLVTNIADDESGNIFLNYADTLSARMERADCGMNIDKIYIDEYVEQHQPTGDEYPDAVSKLMSNLDRGTAVIGFYGIGDEFKFCSEHILDTTMIDTMINLTQPVFLTVLSRFNHICDPDINPSGARLLFNPNGGGIASIGHSDISFASSDFNFSSALTDKLTNTSYSMFGDVFRATKAMLATDAYLLSVSFLGDPAIPILFPKNEVSISSISSDTIFEGQSVTIMGEVDAPGGSVLSGFNGPIDITLFNPLTVHTTLANDPDSYVQPFTLWDDTLYNGQATVTNGYFTHTFIVPAGVDSGVANGKFSFYTHDGAVDADGCYSNVILKNLIAGVDEFSSLEIKAYPNPATENIFVTIGKRFNDMEYALYSSEGKLLETKAITDDHFIIERQNRSAGLFLVRLVRKQGGSNKILPITFN